MDKWVNIWVTGMIDIAVGALPDNVLLGSIVTGREMTLGGNGHATLYIKNKPLNADFIERHVSLVFIWISRLFWGA